MNNINSSLSINNYCLHVLLGTTAEERSILQKVEVSITIFFNKLPDACITNNISDSICYDSVCTKIKNFCYNKEFQLIEHLCFHIFNLLKEEIKFPINISLKKCNPPLENLLGGAEFNITENIN